ncbi:MAG: hypothetical protein HYS14_05765 [Candidatus Rokubacteria bacterium]|nr:hypothetical protein [Candidatus Rokubacteria bacterium]
MHQFLWRGVLLVGLTVGLPLLSLGALAKKEQDDRFCVACHLHEEKFHQFRAPAVKDLTGAHHYAKTSVSCIGCHGGADLPMRFRIRAVAGLDTLRFLVGRYREPERMRFPLRDKDCKQCHDPILRRTIEEEEAVEGRGDTYHAINEHRTVKTSCVSCHTSHTKGEARFQFLDRQQIRPICQDCHQELGIEG